MVKVPLELQAELVGRRAAFEPATGAWGRAGCTMVDLAAAAKADVRRALAAAHRRGLSKS
jgi:hypothetical protein